MLALIGCSSKPKADGYFVTVKRGLTQIEARVPEDGEFTLYEFSNGETKVIGRIKDNVLEKYE